MCPHSKETLTNGQRRYRTAADAAPGFDADIYRLSVSVDGDGWSARLQNGLAVAKPGASAPVTVFVSRGDGSSRTAAVTLRATSECDPAKTATAIVKLAR